MSVFWGLSIWLVLFAVFVWVLWCPARPKSLLGGPSHEELIGREVLAKQADERLELQTKAKEKEFQEFLASLEAEGWVPRTEQESYLIDELDIAPPVLALPQGRGLFKIYSHPDPEFLVRDHLQQYLIYSR